MAVPDVVVGIDFGMTSTGVAYSVGPDWTRPETIQNWPSAIGGLVADKVATKVGYDNNGELISWGFLVQESDPELEHICEELFKLYLDPKFEDGFDDRPPSLQQARKWFVDYLSCIYQAVDRRLRDTIPRYDSKRVEFRFSVPTTWKDPAMIAETEQLIRNAGFGQINLHDSMISLTEAEAAAVYASKQQYNAGDSFLICDAGGGTTDVNILKVVSSGVGQTELEPLNFVEGKAIGSTLIDMRIERMIAARLALVQEDLEHGYDPLEIARQMMRDTTRFESFKCNLGSDAMNHLNLRLQIPHMTNRINSRQAAVQEGFMIITKEELQIEFDKQIQRMIMLIDNQVNILSHQHPNEKIAFIILSGGFGSSPYVQSRLRAYYELGRGGISLAQTVKILHVPKPQLAVCHGLVLDRIQQIKDRRVVYKERFCRNSYGVICRALYNPAVHFNEPVVIDPRDGREWVEQHIDWFIKQGQKVSVEDGIRKHYSLKIPPEQRAQPWGTQIVMSTLPANELPTNMMHSGARRLCRVESRLPANMKMKNRRWYNTGEKYFRAEFDMRVIVGPADLKFQTISSDGVLSRNHEDISIQWAHAEASPRSEVAELMDSSLLNSPRSDESRGWGSSVSNRSFLKDRFYASGMSRYS